MAGGAAAAQRLSGHICTCCRGAICGAGCRCRQQRGWKLPESSVQVSCLLNLLLLLLRLLPLLPLPLLLLSHQQLVTRSGQQVACLTAQSRPLGRGLPLSTVLLLPLRQQAWRRRHIAGRGCCAAPQQRGRDIERESALHERAHRPCSTGGGTAGQNALSLTEQHLSRQHR